MMSYPRHEYFRRLLCEMLGQDIKKGILPTILKPSATWSKTLLTPTQNAISAKHITLLTS